MKGIVKFLVVILVILIALDAVLIFVRNNTDFDGSDFLGNGTEGNTNGLNNGTINQGTGNSLGSSFETAIVIDAINEGQGLSKEHEWLGKNACVGKGGELEIEEELIEHNGSWFDIFRLVCVNGEKETYYFNVDSFNGVWN
ncbi:MAG: hypothetical protein ABIA76_04490 [Candidatus Diapherotrites archaeon]